MFKAIFSNISNTIRGSSRFTEGGTMNLLHNVDIPVEKATFGMGCFWGVDSLYGGKIGVVRTKVGYGGGKVPNPTYYSIGDHTEIIEVDFDPKTVTYEELLKEFWKNHDPSHKIKAQYCSLILYHSPEQKALAEKTRDDYKQKSKKDVQTRIEPFEKFYDAEGYHQKYRLQQHTDLLKALGFKKDDELLKTSHVAARVNGYLVGMSTVKQFEEEAPKLGFNKETTDYIRDYHQKYHLQEHTDLLKALGFKKDDELLKTSHVAARVNAYLVGMSTVKQFEEEAPKLGFNKETIDYIQEYVVKNQGRGMTC